MIHPVSNALPPWLQVAARQSEMGRRIAEKDWHNHPLGPLDQWPTLLCTTLGMLLNSRFPMFLFWGPDLLCFYNDAFRPSLGAEGKHPHALGDQAAVVWPEIWHIIHPQIQLVMEKLESTWHEDQLVPIFRNGVMEDVYWTYSYSPLVNDQGQAAGVFLAVAETTQKKIFEDNLRVSVKQLDELADAMPQLVWMANPEGHTYYFNRQSQRYKPLATPPNKVYDWVALLHPDDQAITVEQWQEAIETESNFTVQHRLTMLDGEYRWHLSRALPQRDAEGKVIRWLGTSTDVHDQRLLLEQATVSQHQLQTVINQAPVIIWALDKEGRYTFSEGSGLNFIGFKPGEVVGRSHFELYADSPQALTTARRALVGEHFTTEIEVRERIYESHYTPLYNEAGEPNGMVAVSTDITERSRAADVIAKSEHRFQQLVRDSIAAIVVVTGPDMLVEVANEAYGKLIARKPEELLGKPLFSLIPETEEYYRPLLEKVRDTGEVITLYESPYHVVTNGQAINGVLNCSFQPNRDGKGEVVGVAIILLDVTETVMARRALERSESRFRQLAESDLIGLVSWNLEGKITEANNSFLKLVGYSEADLAAGRVDWVTMTPQEFSSADEKGIHELETLGYFKPFEKQFRHSNGSVVDVLLGGAFYHGSTTEGFAYILDITDRKRSERAVAESERRFQNLVRDSAAAILVLSGQDMKVEVVNDAYGKLIGQQASSVLGKPLFSVIPETEEYYRPIMAKVMQSGQPITLNDSPYTVTNEAGEVINGFVHVTYQPFRNESGDIIGLMVMVQDVSETVMARLKAEENEAQFRSLVANAPVGICVLEGEELVIKNPNSIFLKMIGRGSDIEGLPLLKAMPELSREAQPLYDKIKHVLHTGEELEFSAAPVVVDKDGQPTQGYYDVRYTPLVNAEGKVFAVLNMAADVTERVTVQKRVEESERRFRSLAEASPMFVMVADAAMRMEYLNTPLKDYLGLTPSMDDDFEAAWSQALHPTEATDLVALKTKAEANRQPFSAELRLKHHSTGHYNWFLLTGVPRFEGDEFIGYVFNGVNIQQQKEQLEALREVYKEADQQKRLYETVTNSTPDLVYVLDLNYRFTYANKALLTMWGKSWEAAVGKGLRENGYEEWHAALHEKEIEDIKRSGKPVRGEVSFPHATLGRRVYDYILTPVVDEEGKVTAIAGTTRDITDIRQSEEKIAASEELFRTFSNNINNLAWIADGDGYIWWYNQRWYDYTGTTLEDMEGWGWQKVHHPDYVQGVIDAATIGWKQTEPWELTFPLRSAAGDFQWFLTKVVPILNTEGKVIRWIGTNTNIDSERRLSNHLEELVAERTEALRAANENLQRSNEDLLQFAHVASHDLKEPVRKVKVFANRLEAELAHQLADKGNVYLNKIHSATDRMNQMIEGVLQYSTINAASQRPTPVDLNEVMHSIETDLEVTLGRSGGRLVFSQLPTAEGAQVLLYQCFYNLVNNSVKFAREGVAPCINIHAAVVEQAGRSMAEITFADNGIGFENEYATHIFHTFTRLHSKDRFEGTGLGLSLCKKIVERHGGSIEAQGQPGVSATFFIRLPMKQDREGI